MEKITWKDIFDLQEKFKIIERSIKLFREGERSDEFRQKFLQDAEWVSGIGIKDIDYLADTKLLNSERPYGLSLQAGDGQIK